MFIYFLLKNKRDLFNIYLKKNINKISTQIKLLLKKYIIALIRSKITPNLLVMNQTSSV